MAMCILECFELLLYLFKNKKEVQLISKHHNNGPSQARLVSGFVRVKHN